MQMEDNLQNRTVNKKIIFTMLIFVSTGNIRSNITAKSSMILWLTVLPQAISNYLLIPIRSSHLHKRKY
jgi:hypothetical protein